MKTQDRFFLFMQLPVELRQKVYRSFLISRLDYSSHTNIWRPIAADDGVFKIGLFRKGTVTSILLVSRQIHAEAAAVLYGENVFLFHISGFAEGPLTFLEKLSPQYVRLLRRVYIRTGYYVRNPRDHRGAHLAPPREEAVAESQKDLAMSVALVRQAWPMKYKNIHVDGNPVRPHAEPSMQDQIKQLRGWDHFEEWMASSWYLWQMVTTESEAEEPRKEFQCIDWESWRSSRK